MNSNLIRSEFLNFFKNKNHKIVESAPMVIKNDPTLMFTNAGMNQFKDNFLGNRVSNDKRVVDTQKCLRVSGKHNDLEEVGIDTYHHTMFEMLGNWSFGDYFKKEAISWAWELLTEVYKIDNDSLYITVFQGSKEDNTLIDQEAYDIWSKIVEKDKIILGNKEDNFWEMGDNGPCGPCSAMTKSEITIKNVSWENLGQIPVIFGKLGIEIKRKGNDIYIPEHKDGYEIQNYIDGSILTISDAPWPGFTPDLISIVLVVATQAKGSVLIHQKMFESRLVPLFPNLPPLLGNEIVFDLYSGLGTITQFLAKGAKKITSFNGLRK